MTTATTTNTRAEEFNGWSNRETWAVNLWLCNNDESTYSAALATVAEGDEFEAAEALEAMVEAWLEEISEGGFTGIVNDLLGSAMMRCNWAEVVRSLRAE